MSRWRTLRDTGRFTLERHLEQPLLRKRAATAEHLRALHHEGRVLAHLRGLPCVVTLREVHDDALILDHLPGAPLAPAWWGAQPLARRLEAAARFIEAVAAVHARGVVHGDLKPSNALVAEGPDGALTVTLIDLDAALFQGQASGAGTRRTSSPEALLLPHPELLDARHDHFSAALLLRGLLLGAPHQLTDARRWRLLRGEPLTLNPPDPSLLPLVTALAPHLAAWRSERPDDLGALTQALHGRPSPPPAAYAPGWPEACARAWEVVAYELAPEAQPAVRADLERLLPLGAPASPQLPEESWLKLLQDLARRRALLAEPDPERLQEAARIGLRAGLAEEALASLDAIDADGAEGVLGESAAAMALGACGSALELLRASEHRGGAWEALLTSALARLGREEEALQHLRAAVQRPPGAPARMVLYWEALSHALLTLGGVEQLALLTDPATLPRHRLVVAGPVVMEVLQAHTEAVEALADQLPARHPAPQREVLARALGQIVLRVHLQRVRLALECWPLAEAGLEPLIVSTLATSGARLTRLRPDSSLGPLLEQLAAAVLFDPDAAASHLEAARARDPILRQALQVLPSPTRQDAALWHQAVAAWSLGLLPLQQPLRAEVAPRLGVEPGFLDEVFARVAAQPGPSPPSAPAPEVERLLVTRAVQALQRGEPETVLAVVLDALRQGAAPRGLWEALLEAELTRRPPRRRFVRDLLAALETHGFSRSDALCWRMRLELRHGAHREVIAMLRGAHQEGLADWRSWTLAIDAWLALGQLTDARMAVTHLQTIGAPEEVVRVFALKVEVERQAGA